MSDEIYKAVLTIPVMGAAASAEEFRRQLSSMSLSDIMEDADSGSLISGSYHIETVEHVHRADVAGELQELGNDGTFFDCEIGMDDDDDGDDDGADGDDGP